VYALLATGSIWLSHQPGAVATLRFANAAGVAFLLLRPYREWTALLGVCALGNLTANAIFHSDLLVSLSFLPGNLAEIALAAWMLRATNLETDWQSNPGRPIAALVLGCGIAPVAGATIGAAIVQAHGFGGFTSAWKNWFVGDVVGSLAILPAAVAVVGCLRTSGFRCATIRSTAPTSVLVGAWTWLVLANERYPFVLIVLALIFAAHFSRFASVAIATSTAILVVAVYETVHAPPSQAMALVHFLDVLVPMIIVGAAPLLFAAQRERQLESEVQLRQTVDHFRNTYRESPALLHTTDDTGHILDVSEAWLGKMGYRRCEVLGLPFENFVAPESVSRLNAYESVRRESQTDRPSLEIQLVTKQGRALTAEYQARGDCDELTGEPRELVVLRDVTRERELAAHVEAELEWLTVTLDAISESVVLVTEAETVRYMNRAAEDMLGLAFCEVAGLSFQAVFGIEDPQQADYPADWRIVQTATGPRVIQVREAMIDANGSQAAGFVVVLTDVDDVAQALRAQTDLARTDGLTGLANRLAFQEALDNLIQGTQPFAIFMIDLDGFKAVNDRLGHEAGDAVLTEVGRRLKRILRANDVVARLGGDEFAVLLPGIHAAETARGPAQLLIDLINKPMAWHEDEMQVGASLGVAFFPGDAASPAMLSRKADMAMYQAKRAGKNQVAVYGQPAAA
jgi:diguanylate cyclase (GGDEF)-like protein/PAS domain S-box-containing protein